MAETRIERGAATPRAANRSAGRRRTDRIVGSSRAMQDVVDQAISAAAGDLPVRISGPEGSGKDHLARAIHAWSARSTGPFVVISCAAVPSALRGRELFGCVSATYPSLPDAHEGGFQRAAGGTLLIDHADSLPSDLAQGIAKAISGGHFQREGDASALPLRARVIAVSREPLSGTLFSDLPHHDLRLPSLAERGDDILPLATHFLASHAAEQGVEPVGFTGDARSALCAETWNGNARELSERIEQALRLTGSGAISAEALMLSAESDDVPSFKDAKRMFERRYVTGLLRRCGGNISRAARLAKKDRKDFYDVIRRTGVDPADFR